ncbi:MAG: glycosyltransferase family 2 protein [Ginsengibacter sp.]
MAYPKISIVTPSFNQGKYIEKTIQSVLDQGYPNLEYIIIDGGSTDNTIDVIKKYESHIAYWISEKDKGQTDAINKGFAKCSGEIFNWINSDDYYEPETFKKLSTFFTSNPSINIVCGREWGFNDANSADKILHAGSVIKNNVYETIRYGIIDQPCTFFRKKNIDEFFPLDISLHFVMDRQLWWNYLLKYGQQNILVTNEIFTNFRFHPQSKSSGEADLFEAEFDQLKLSLFQQLHAPIILEEQLANNKALKITWQVHIHPINFILAAFASFFAERRYVKEDMYVASKLMKLVKQWKQWRMNKKEWKLWIATNLIPISTLKVLKKLKHLILPN